MAAVSMEVTFRLLVISRREIMVSSTGVKLAALVDGVDDLGLHPETRKAFGRAHDQSQETLFANDSD
jgi:hypothetical protein